MSYIVEDFSKWKAMNEADAPVSVTVRARLGQKVVLNPIDARSLKIKIKNDADILDVSEKLTASGFQALVDFIKTQPTIINYYSKLNDLVTNIVVYTVERDSPSTQVITFNIGSKTELGGTINSQVKYARQDEIEELKAGKILNVASPLAAAATSTELKLPIAAATIVGSKDAKLVEFIKSAYLKVKKEPLVAQNPVMVTLKSEISTGVLGEGSKAFIAGLNAGFGIKDWSGDDVELNLTQKLVDKLALVAEAESQFIPGFDPELFNAQVTLLTTSATGDIKVPTGGFKEGLQNDPEMKKVQDLLLKKFAKHLANHSAYQKFKKAGAKGFLGNYGPLTTELVRLIKIGFEDPYFPNRDGSTIEAEFINRLQNDPDLKESTGFYLGLDGKTLIVEGWSAAAVNAVAPSAPVVDTPSRERDSQVDTPAKEDKSKVYQLQEVPDWEYKLVNKIVHVKKPGGKWQLSGSPTYIKKVIAKVRKDGLPYAFALMKKDAKGVAIRQDERHYHYKDNKWQVWLNGGWEPTIASTTKTLEDFYGKGTPYVSADGASSSSGSSSTGTGATIAEVDKELTAIGNAIKSFVEGSDTFSAYKSWSLAGGDDEDGAWNDVLFPEWKNNWSIKVNKISTKVKNSTAIKESDKERYRTSIDTIREMFTNLSYTIFGTIPFYQAFQGSADYDDFDLKLKLSGSQVKKINIQCDF